MFYNEPDVALSFIWRCFIQASTLS